MPIAPNNNNKESFRLLDLSSDVSSEDLQLEIAPVKRKKVHRKSRARGGARSPDIATHRQSPLQCGVRVAGWVVVFSWLVVLTFILSAIGHRLEGIDARLATLTTTSDGVSDAIQDCHSAAKELRASTSALGERLTALALAHDALASNYTDTAAKLAKLQEKLPKMADQVNTDELVKIVADMGSKLSGMEAVVKSVQETANAAKQGVEELRELVNSTSVSVNTSSVERQDNSARLLRLDEAVRALNDTISVRLQSTESQLSKYVSQISEDSKALQEVQAQLQSLTSNAKPGQTTVPTISNKESVTRMVAGVPAPPATAPAPAPPPSNLNSPPTTLLTTTTVVDTKAEAVKP